MCSPAHFVSLLTTTVGMQVRTGQHGVDSTTRVCWLDVQATPGTLSKETESRGCAMSTCKMSLGKQRDFRNRTPNGLSEMSTITWSYYDAVSEEST